MAQAGVLERDPLTDDSRVVIDASAEALLSDGIRQLVRDAIALMRREADRQMIPWTQICVRGIVDPEEGDRTINLTQLVSVPQDAADSYWESLDGPIDDWLGTLPDEDVDTVYRSIFFRVRVLTNNGRI